MEWILVLPQQSLNFHLYCHIFTSTNFPQANRLLLLQRFVDSETLIILLQNSDYLICGLGNRVSLFIKKKTLDHVTSFQIHDPERTMSNVTWAEFHPLDNNFLVVGLSVCNMLQSLTKIEWNG
jgi:hypothetical protein